MRVHGRLEARLVISLVGCLVGHPVYISVARFRQVFRSWDVFRARLNLLTCENSGLSLRLYWHYYWLFSSTLAWYWAYCFHQGIDLFKHHLRIVALALALDCAAQFCFSTANQLDTFYHLFIFRNLLTQARDLIVFSGNFAI